MSKRRRTRPEASGGKPSEASLFSEPMPARRFPAPWSAELQPNYYVVRDANGQRIACVYYENEPGRRSALDVYAQAEHHQSRHTERSRDQRDQRPYIGSDSPRSFVSKVFVRSIHELCFLHVRRRPRVDLDQASSSPVAVTSAAPLK